MAQVAIARLPATNRDLFGREAELAWLDACWNDGVRVASVIAFGGVGKSALVNAWLRQMDRGRWRGAERVYAWSFYSQGTDRLASSDEFFAHALKWFGDTDPTQGSPWDKGERLAKLVRRKRTLLILDGVEPLQWGPGVQQGRLKDPAMEALVKELGAQNEGLCLFTSRIGLSDLDALSQETVRAKDLANLSPEAGAELLRARGAKGTDDELREAAKEYKGHSLALTLLGSYLEDVAEGDIRRRKEIGALAQDERKGGHARRVMAAYERWFNGGPEMAILRMLGLFDRPASEGEIDALRDIPAVPGLTDALARIGWDKWNKAIFRLRRSGLLAQAADGNQDRTLDAHPIVREHFGEQLQREQPAAWQEGHRRLYEYHKKNSKLYPDTIEEMTPLYAAVVHGCRAGRHQDALHAVLVARIRRGPESFDLRTLGAVGSEAVILAAFFDPPWEHVVEGLNDAEKALILHDAGFVLRALGRLSEAIGLMQKSVERIIALQDWSNASNFSSNVSEALQARGDLHEALVYARTSVSLASNSSEANALINSETTLATILHKLGDSSAAVAIFEETERMQRVLEPARPLLYVLRGFHYCDALLDQDRYTDVAERAAQTLQWVTARNWTLFVALDHLSLGRANHLIAQRGAIDKLAQAAFHLARAVDGLRHSGQQDYLPLGLLARAALHTHTRNFADTRRDLDEALTLATRSGFRLHEADAHLGYARLFLAEGNRPAAREHLAKARAIIDETGYHRRDGELAELESAASS
ncbi:tetratricopeptide repeat protein [Polyangium sp. 6x1]|uniref:tetratricopeptide repeat protein n=1 Tax=Polyangium sp. 6x1 TaxID=3042689 RepID=UPI002482126C|nr:tetratricopeptide repeat protein [Polyangium sp. 6x1]MDI1451402.1 tetratricopeptide repeat protein [Polyangium sp. 6x1]